MLLIKAGENLHDLEDAFLSYVRLSLYDVWCLEKEQFGSEGSAGAFLRGQFPELEE